MSKDTVQKEKLMAEAREQISKAISAALIDVREEQERSRRDNRQFKEDTGNLVNRLRRSNERLCSELSRELRQENDKRYNRWNASLGAIKTNWIRKLYEAIDTVMTDEENYCDLQVEQLSRQLRLELLNSRNLIMNRIKATLAGAVLGLLLSLVNLGVWIYVLQASGFWR